ncbi:hypothetical protein B0T25DRAFT_531239 [Lasiosphaeria hispida]|uniref:Uncharacterized protein n=1 Tax=Lasiosphaeria hispida TaxID=260671 RepID=A0AAJ0MH24_9PEZI|nr:hypothetical protein B0T25DRAFT_531239 [Lasiosphaeria hispida]
MWGHCSLIGLKSKGRWSAAVPVWVRVLTVTSTATFKKQYFLWQEQREGAEGRGNGQIMKIPQKPLPIQPATLYLVLSVV